MHINFKEVKAVGAQAFGVAIVGTLAPVAFGLLFVGLLCDGKYYPDGFAAGVALAPTSVGIAIKLLNEAKILSSTPGQTILTATFVDDIFSLVLLVILLTLAVGVAKSCTPPARARRFIPRVSRRYSFPTGMSSRPASTSGYALYSHARLPAVGTPFPSRHGPRCQPMAMLAHGCHSHRDVVRVLRECTCVCQLLQMHAPFRLLRRAQLVRVDLRREEPAMT